MEESKLLYSDNYVNIFINSKYIHWKSHSTKCTMEDLDQLLEVSSTILNKLYEEKKMIGLIWDMRSTQTFSPSQISKITKFVSGRTEKNDAITIASLVIIESIIIRNLFNTETASSEDEVLDLILVKVSSQSLICFFINSGFFKK